MKVSLEQYQIMFSVGLELNVEILHRGRRKTKENTLIRKIGKVLMKLYCLLLMSTDITV